MASKKSRAVDRLAAKREDQERRTALALADPNHPIHSPDWTDPIDAVIARQQAGGPDWPARRDPAPDTFREVTTPAPGGATDKQVALLVNLYRDLRPHATDEAIAAATDRARAMTKKAASDKITELLDRKAKARADRPAPDPSPDRPTQPGPYRLADGRIVKVKISRTSGKPYAVDFNGDYLGGGRLLDGAMRLSLDEAKAYGRETGVCCVCSAELTNPDSIAAGIGPICAGRL